MDASGILTPADDELTLLMKETIRKVRIDGYILNTDGIFNEAAISFYEKFEKRMGHPARKIDETTSPFNFQNPRLRLLFSIIPLLLRKSERKHVYSYSGKHVVEDLFQHSYISNGEFILVCIALGYKFKYDPNSPNCNIFGMWVDTIPISYSGQIAYGKHKFPC